MSSYDMVIQGPTVYSLQSHPQSDLRVVAGPTTQRSVVRISCYYGAPTYLISKHCVNNTNNTVQVDVVSKTRRIFFVVPEQRCYRTCTGVNATGRCTTAQKSRTWIRETRGLKQDMIESSLPLHQFLNSGNPEVFDAATQTAVRELEYLF